MKKFFILFTIIFFQFHVQCQNIEGDWNGMLKFGGIQLRLVFHIEKTDTGYTSTLDSPDQGAKGIPVNSSTFKDSILKLIVKNLGIKYEGKLNSNNEFVGDFVQAGASLPLILTQNEIEKAEISRPQEPIEPFPYYTEEVKFNNDSIVFSGTLSLPHQKGNFPAVVLISGSGPQNRDEEVFGHKPFLVIADFLTRSGIAVLRFDDRGTAESTGNFKSATTMDFASDIESAVNFLKSRKEINKNKIGLIGHSEGGIIAPIVASRPENNIDFIVLLAGTGIPGDQILLMQQQLIGNTAGESEEYLQKTQEFNKEIFDIIKSSDPERVEEKLTTHLKNSIKNNPYAERNDQINEEEIVEELLQSTLTPWMKYFIAYDPATHLEKVQCPVLAINGEKDLQVPAKENIQAIEAALKRGGNTKVTTEIVPNLNHLFQESETGSPDEYGTIEQTFSPKVLHIMSDWIIKQVK